jgi:hypothetical protein
MKIEPTQQITEEMEHYENFELSPEKTAEAEKMIREDRKNELRKLAFNKHLHQETYYLINKQFEREIKKHPPENIAELHFNNKPEDIIDAFRYVINKEKNISSTRAIKIQAGLTIQIEKHSKNPMKNYV